MARKTLKTNGRNQMYIKDDYWDILGLEIGTVGTVEVIEDSNVILLMKNGITPEIALSGLNIIQQKLENEISEVSNI